MRELRPLVAAATCLFTAAAVIHAAGGRISYLLRDPAELSAAIPLAGALSHLGVGLWVAAAVMAMLGAIASSQRERTFLALSCILSITLGLDDALRLHEDFFPRMLGIPEMSVIGAYVLGTAALIWFFRMEIRQHRFILLVAAIALFALSISLDVAEALAADSAIAPSTVDRYTDAFILLEDGSKLLGIFAWLLFFAQRRRAVRHSE